MANDVQSKEQNRDQISEGLSPDQIALIQDYAKGIAYGTLTLVFQNGHLLQIERNEKIRIK